MKIKWVNRFNKLRKGNGQSSPKNAICSVLFLSLAVEEEMIIRDLHDNFSVPWLENMLVSDRESGINFMKSVCGTDSLKPESLETYKCYISSNVLRFILPRLTTDTDLCCSDIGQILRSPAAGIAGTFCQAQAAIGHGVKLVNRYILVLSDNQEYKS